MDTLFQLGLILLLLNNLAMLGARRLPSLIYLGAVQGILLALLLVIPGKHGVSLEHVLLASAVLIIKGIGLPVLLLRTFRRIASDSYMHPHIGYGLSVMAGMLAFVFSLWLEGQLPVPPAVFPQLLLPAALTTLLSGLLLVVGRYRALVQVIGYLIAENGIFLLSIPLMNEGTLWFEMTLLLDVFVAVFVMGIAINHINRTFETIDSGRFCNLHD